MMTGLKRLASIVYYTKIEIDLPKVIT